MIDVPPAADCRDVAAMLSTHRAERKQVCATRGRV